MSDQTPQNPANSTGLIRLSDAARIVGVTPYVFAGALLDREIPLNIVRLGKTHFVRSAELHEWLAPKPAHAEDLFK